MTERQSGGDIVHCVVSEWVSVTEGVCVTGGGGRGSVSLL